MDCIAIQSLCPRHSQAGRWTGRWARGWACRQALGVGAGQRAAGARAWYGRAGAHGRCRQARSSRLEPAGRVGDSSARARGAAGARAGGAQARWACAAGGASMADRHGARSLLGAREPGLVFNLVFRLGIFPESPNEHYSL